MRYERTGLAVPGTGTREMLGSPVVTLQKRILHFLPANQGQDDKLHQDTGVPGVFLV